MEFSTGDKKLIKDINTFLVFKIIQEHESISRPEISDILGLTPATVSSIINGLKKNGHVVDAGIGSSTGGRKPVLVKLNGDAMYFIGVAIQKNHVEAAVINLNGKIICKEIAIFEKSNQSVDFIEKTLQIINLVIDKSGQGRTKFSGIGVGMHGIVNTKTGISIFAPAMLSRNVDLKKILEDHLQIPVFIDNDSRAMAIGEQWFGEARGRDNFVYINVGKGIGSGIVLKGELFDGNNFAAGEVGHIRVVENGAKCVCGNYGCLDTVASEYSLIRDVASRVQMGIPSIISELAGGDINRITRFTVLEAADRGDNCARESLVQIGRYLGAAVSYIANILNPDMVVIGGSLSIMNDYLLKPLIEAAKEASMKECISNTSIVISSLKENSGIFGGAAMVMRDIFKNPRWGRIT